MDEQPRPEQPEPDSGASGDEAPQPEGAAPDPADRRSGPEDAERGPENATPPATPPARTDAGDTPDAGPEPDRDRTGQEALEAIGRAERAAAGLGGGTPVNLPDLAGSPGESRREPIEFLGDVNLDVRIELGRTRMLVEDVLRLGEGSVVELDKLAGDPVDVYVNGRHVARGEVLVLNDNFCIRVNEITDAPGGGAG